MLAGLLTLLVVAGATLALAVRLLAQRRTAEAALLAARGASRIQLARRALIDAAIVAVPALMLGPLIGSWLALLLLRAGLRPGRHRRSRASPASTANVPGWRRRWSRRAAWSSPPCPGCAAPIAAAAPGRPRAGSARSRRPSAPRPTSPSSCSPAAAAWQLINSRSAISAGLGGALSADPILLLAPVLALVAGALLTLRLLPLAARLGDRVASRGRGLVMPVAAWQISRRTLRQAGPTLVGVLAVAAAVMALSPARQLARLVQRPGQLRSRRRHQDHDPARRQLPLGQISGITGAPGVTGEHAGGARDDQPAQRQPRNAARAQYLVGADRDPGLGGRPVKAVLSKLSAAVPRDGSSCQAGQQRCGSPPAWAAGRCRGSLSFSSSSPTRPGSATCCPPGAITRRREAAHADRP